jgi:hypothetical protein
VNKKTLEWLLVVAIVGLSAVVSAKAQCPVAVLNASLSSEGSLSVSYQNQSRKVIRAAGFILQLIKEPKQAAQFSASSALRPGEKATVRYQFRELEFSFGRETQNLEAVVNHVVFADRSTWSPPVKNSCKISVTQP